MTISAGDILKTLDEGADTYDFPTLNNIYFYFGKIKIAIFRNANEWLLIFQELSFFIKSKKFVNTVYVFGNTIEGTRIQFINQILFESADDKMFDYFFNLLLNPLDFQVVIKGDEKRFTPTPKEYQDIGIDIEDEKMPVEAKIIRYLTNKIPELLFFNHDELLEMCEKKDSNLKLFMELDDWYHPDLVDDELPSDSPCFVSLAEAIEKNDSTIYRCPEDSYNIHWSNWEWYR